MGQPGYVYLVHGKGTNYIKIGKTTNIIKRLCDLQHGVPFPLQLISVELVHDMDASENMLLQRYKQYWTRGEWCECPEDVLSQWPLEAALAAFIINQAASPRGLQHSNVTAETHDLLAFLTEHVELTLQEIYAWMEATTRKERTRIDVKLCRLWKSGLIGKSGRGIYHAIPVHSQEG